MQAWLDKLPLPRPLMGWVVLPLWHAILRLSKPEVRIVTGGISFYALFAIFPLIYLTLTLLFSLLPHDLSASLSNTTSMRLWHARVSMIPGQPGPRFQPEVVPGCRGPRGMARPAGSSMRA